MRIGPFENLEKAIETCRVIELENPKVEPNAALIDGEWFVLVDKPTALQFYAEGGNMLGKTK